MINFYKVTIILISNVKYDNNSIVIQERYLTKLSLVNTNSIVVIWIIWTFSIAQKHTLSRTLIDFVCFKTTKDINC